MIDAGLKLRRPTAGPTGSFATAAVEATAGADTHSLAVTGTFGDDGFEAQVVAEVTGKRNRAYTVAWTGTPPGIKKRS